jgi:branched-chain amino acid transport system substrate-binding protein
VSLNWPALAVDKVLRIGMVAPISGPLAKLGQETVIGSQIAADMTNERGGIGGKKVALVVADTPTPDLAKSAVERLATSDKLKVIVGNYGSSLAIAASTTANRYGAFYWEQSSSSYDITRKAPNSVKTTWGNYELIQRLNDVLKNVLGPKLGKPVGELKIALMHEDSGWGSELAQMSKDPATAGDLKLSFVQGYNAARTSDFTPMILRLKGEAPDVLVAASYQVDAIKFQQQAKEQDFYVKAMIGFTAGYGISDFATALGKSADDVLVIDSNPEINPASMTPEAQQLTRDFIDRFRNKTGKAPASHALYAFLGSYALMNYVLPKTPSMEAADILKTAMALDMPYGKLPMAFGLEFTPTNAERPRYNKRGLTVLNQWRDGRLVAVYPAQYATAELRNMPLPPWSKR